MSGVEASLMGNLENRTHRGGAEAPRKRGERERRRVAVMWPS
jgi:hypothetical protein